MRLLALAALLLGSALPAHESSGFTEWSKQLESFTLTDGRTGEAFTPEQLRGKVWVAHFFFTTCTQGCSETNRTMQELQKRFADHRHVAFVSISVNPAHDKPEVLRAFAENLEARPGQWFFLTGGEADVHRIVRSIFYQGVETNPGAPLTSAVTHAFRLLLINHEGAIVGYADGKDRSAPELLERAINRSLLGGNVRAPHFLPTLNAGLNTLCTLLLIFGYAFIRNGREKLHIACMLSALAVSALFLGCYLYYHFVILDGQPTRFRHEGPIRVAYFTILLTHTVLAASVAPLALWTAYLGLTDQRLRHRWWARRTLPIWLYVSITGVVVYWMLYQMG